MVRLDKNRAGVFLLTLLILVGLIAVAIRSASFSMIEEIGFGWPGADGRAERRSSTSYIHNWDDNPVAYVPEAALGSSGGYAHNWDDNPVAYIPETALGSSAGGYAHNWDDNPVAYIPETALGSSAGGYAHNWDDNPVAYIPETSLSPDQ